MLTGYDIIVLYVCVATRRTSHRTKVREHGYIHTAVLVYIFGGSNILAEESVKGK